MNDIIEKLSCEEKFQFSGKKFYQRQRCSMQRGDTVYVRHILDGLVRRFFLHKIEQGELDTDEMLAFSLIHLLGIVGEAANSVSADFQSKDPHIP